MNAEEIFKDEFIDSMEILKLKFITAAIDETESDKLLLEIGSMVKAKSQIVATHKFVCENLQKIADFIHAR